MRAVQVFVIHVSPGPHSWAATPAAPLFFWQLPVFYFIAVYRQAQAVQLLRSAPARLSRPRGGLRAPYPDRWTRLMFRLALIRMFAISLILLVGPCLP